MHSASAILCSVVIGVALLCISLVSGLTVAESTANAALGLLASLLAFSFLRDR
ncbi:hypothetical protein [Sediminivirga luteola]|uniref:Uncharacterized protein n=1 Tax=Sediminivirga luteola TaxID=1774748 RepID=A0A8J2XK18_9MICO|nr:hypothetical protein [Sediminivirga luteola]MCI2265486.1 hypothetical protein [Sediminivirga luteola]GGA10246.1 hypothetical protein GCM10011333_11210 [Sediminivirga luteola]